MAVNALLGGESCEFSNFSYDAVENCFRSEFNEAAGFSMVISTPLKLDPAFNNKPFEVYPLVKRDLVENEIFQVFEKPRDRRIGWCIPVNALCSIDHDCAEDIHFQRYAFAALLTFLNSSDSTLHANQLVIEGDQIVSLAQILPSSTSLFIVSVETLVGDFSLARWLPSFATMGYFPLSSVNPEELCVSRGKVVAREVKIFPVSGEIQDCTHLSLIYGRTYPYEKSATFQFFYLYQVLEYLMDLVFRNDQKKLIDRFIAVQNDLNATKDLLQGLSGNVSEKKRMARLVSNYCSASGDLGDLINSCCDLLDALGIKRGNSLETTVYQIRNFIFHQFRNFPASAEGQLVPVVQSFEAFLSVLLSKFRVPTEESDVLE